MKDGDKKKKKSALDALKAGAKKAEVELAIQQGIVKERPFPIEAFPDPLQLLIKNAKESNDFSPDFFGSGIISLFSSIIGNAFAVSPKNGWIEPALVWIAIVGNPSVKKTPALKLALQPLYDLQKGYDKEYDEATEMWEEARDVAKLTNTPIEKAPTRRTLYVNDSTIEALAKILESNNRGVMQFSDELLGWLSGMSRYKQNSSDLQQWLQIYNASEMRVMRITRDDTIVKRGFVSVLGGIQPGVISKLAENGNGENGFLYRLLFAYPDPEPPEDWSEEELQDDLVAAYADAVKGLNRLCFETLAGNSGERQILKLHPEAKRVYIEWYKENRKWINKSTCEKKQSIYSKLEGVALRLSLILQMMGFAFEKALYPETKTPCCIEKQSVIKAIKLTEYFRYMSFKTHGLLEKPINPRIKEVAELIKCGMTYREVEEKTGTNRGTISKWRRKFPAIFPKKVEN